MKNKLLILGLFLLMVTGLSSCMVYPGAYYGGYGGYGGYGYSRPYYRPWGYGGGYYGGGYGGYHHRGWR